MIFADLSSMDGQCGHPSSKCVAVGWLDSKLEFAVGPTFSEFRQDLRKLCEHPVRKTRGFYDCKLCVGNVARGNGEIHVRGFAGEVFVAPSMVSYYVDVHNYRPPELLIAAVQSIVEV